ncbi:MAG TPA: tetratricopeptide repeat protein [Pyrinomonadaceae bacterium]|nr:tetratricopeptide repeat protein [Pyrinomonadaceae bacterium]
MSVMSKLRATLSLALLTLALTQGVAARQSEARPPYRLWMPGENWALDLDLSEFASPAREDISAEEFEKRPRNLYLNASEMFTSDGSGLQLSTFRKSDGKSHPLHLLVKFTPALARGTAQDFRTFVLNSISQKHSGVRLKKDSLKTWEYKGIPVARYASVYELNVGPISSGILIPTAGTRTLTAYLVKDGYWIILMLSGRDIKEREEALFNSLLDSLKLTDVSAPSSSFDYYHKGRIYYLGRDYSKAVDALAVALTLEHRQRRLDQASWRGLMSNLIDSLAQSGDARRAKEALDYAAAQDPAHPRFQLALARYYASVGDLDKTIAYLERAFRNDAAGETPPLPDPKDDPAFERFRKNEKFRQAVKALKK